MTHSPVKIYSVSYEGSPCADLHHMTIFKLAHRITPFFSELGEKSILTLPYNKNFERSSRNFRKRKKFVLFR